MGAAWYLAVASERFAMYLQTAWPTESSFARSRYIPDPGSIEGLLLGPLGPQIPLTSLRNIPGPRIPKMVHSSVTNHVARGAPGKVVGSCDKQAPTLLPLLEVTITTPLNFWLFLSEG